MPESLYIREMSETTPYRVLARKYRPQNFDQLIGQEALVRTLKNAIESGRIAHAYMLTGVRGVGKTTTARIIAKALNYKGPDGKAGPTVGPTDDCALCKAISEDRHPDVIEMDAASRTGIDDIREILDGVRYAPTEARYKIYIIDEVHMLSKNAFNALLKTLEEPPPHVKFIFATTEIRKVPITVLSRCQRFDLRRVDAATLSQHYKNIAGWEKVAAEDEAFALIARAADGSVRDGLSLLDQAIALGGDKVTAAQVKDMLGLADRARSLDLLENALSGKMPEALTLMDALYKSGADPITLIQDLLELTHFLTRLRAAPEIGDFKSLMTGDEAQRLSTMSKILSMPTLGRTWQILLKGLAEAQNSPDAQAAVEMVIIRLSYAADLPDPADLIKKLKDQPAGHAGSPNSSETFDRAPSSQREPATVNVRGPGNSGAQAALQIQTHHHLETETLALKSFPDIVTALEQNSEFLLAAQVFQCAHLVKMEEGRLELRPSEDAPPRMAQDLSQALSRIAGRRWMVVASSSPGQKTLAEQGVAAKAQQFTDVINLPIIQDILKVFPDAKLTDIIETKE